VLDFTLGSAVSALSTGELVEYPYLIETGYRKRLSRSALLCSCGAPLPSCELWSDVTTGLTAKFDLAEFRRINGLYERSWSLPVILLAYALHLKHFKRHIRAMEYLVQLAASHSGSRTIIDSSKFPSRALLYLLAPREDVDVRFVHLIRNGLSYLDSCMSREDPGAEVSGPTRYKPIARIAFTLQWIWFNALSSVIGFVFRDRYLLLHYEDLIRKPVTTMQRIGNALNMDVRDVCERIDDGRVLSAGHIIAENRSKFERVLRVETGREKGSPQQVRGSLTFSSLAGWLQRLYGYESTLPRPGE
jgi:hypothetical protein